MGNQTSQLSVKPDASDIRRARERFLADYPDYTRTAQLDKVRRKEYKRLDRGEGEVYLDYTGGGLYPAQLVKQHQKLLGRQVFGNPHSVSPASLRSTQHEKAARLAVLAFLDADPAVYDVIFTANATGALKLVAESYPFDSSKELLLTLDAHNSVNGMGAMAKAAGSPVQFIGLDAEDSSIREADLLDALHFTNNQDRPGLLVLTGQSNITGLRYRESWIAAARKAGWHVCLDAAALAASTSISLRRTPVDFLAMSLYKIIGYPTGVGALVVRRDVLQTLRRPAFWGGTITALGLPSLEFRNHVDHAGFEDGTINYLALAAVEPGLQFVKPLMPLMAIRTGILLRYLSAELERIEYDDPAHTRMIEVRGPPAGAPNRGGVLPLLVYAPSPRKEDPLIESCNFILWSAARKGISLRGGPCLCKYGASSSVVRRPLDGAVRVEGETEGLIRVSVGLVSNFEDCFKLVWFCGWLAKMVNYEKEHEIWYTSMRSK